MPIKRTISLSSSSATKKGRVAYTEHCSTTLSSSSTTRKRRVAHTEHSLTRESSSGWSQLLPELFEQILSRLSFVQIIGFKAVCSSWRRAAESYISSTRYKPFSFSQAPWLMLPSQEYDPESVNHCDSRCFYSFQEKEAFTINYAEKLFSYNDWCIGSSHGWLILFPSNSHRFEPFLFNPLSRARIELPPSSKLTAFNILLPRRSNLTAFRKAILLSDPSHDKDYRVVLLLADVPRAFMFCGKGISYWISYEDGATEGYVDIISCNNHLYASTIGNSVEVWDFCGSLPEKKMEFQLSTPRKLVEAFNSYKDSYFSQSYLVNSCGDLFLVVRVIGNFVNHEGQVVDEAYLLSDEDPHPLVCPYQTKMFHVYKMDSSKKNWVDVESLDDQLLFVGANHSMSISAKCVSRLERNSIYFTDDNWEQMTEDYLYGGHDSGVFNLEDKTVKLFNWHDLGKISPPPFWVVPNPWGKNPDV